MQVSFYLANHNIPFQCSLSPNSSSCTGGNAIERNTQGNIFVQYEIEVDGFFGPYQMCNPWHGWETADWSCLTYCENPPDCLPWTSQKDQLGWMGPTCFCANGRSNRTVGRSLRMPSSHHHHPNPPSWPARCGAAGYNDISAMGYMLNGTVYKTLANVTADQCCSACAAEPSEKCSGFWMQGDGAAPGECRLSTEPTVWVSDGGRNVTSGGRFHSGAGRISDGALGGFWLSMPSQGECQGAARPGDGSGCTWRVLKEAKHVNGSCATAGVDSAIVAHGHACFASCPDPTKVFTECWQDCFAQTVQGNSTAGVLPMDRDAVVAPFLKAFSSSNISDGGCPDLRPTEY